MESSRRHRRLARSPIDWRPRIYTFRCIDAVARLREGTRVERGGPVGSDGGKRDSILKLDWLIITLLAISFVLTVFVRHYHGCMARGTSVAECFIQ